MSFKRGERVVIEGNPYVNLNGTGTIVMWRGSISDGMYYHVRVDGQFYPELDREEYPEYTCDSDNHRVETQYIRKMTPLEHLL